MCARKGKSNATVIKKGRKLGSGLKHSLTEQIKRSERDTLGKHYSHGTMLTVGPDGTEERINTRTEPDKWAAYLRSVSTSEQDVRFVKTPDPEKAQPTKRTVPPMSNKYPSKVALRGLPPNVSDMYERRAHQALWCYTKDAAMCFHSMQDLFLKGGVHTDEDALRLAYYRTCITPNAWWVSKQITRNILEASRGLENYTLEEEMFTEPAGFVWFEGALPVADISMPRAMAYDAPNNVIVEAQLDAPLMGFAWVRQEERVMLFLLADTQKQAHLHPMGGVAASTNVGLMGYAFFIGDTLEGMIDHMRHERYGADEEHDDRSRLQLVGAFLLWCRQKILVEGGRQSPDRAARRRVEGLKRPDERSIDMQEIKIVTLRSALRKPSEHDDAEDREHEAREYSCQWIVRGFWRNQWYASKQIHQSIYVDSYVKGPPDKPLRIPRQTLFAVTR